MIFDDSFYLSLHAICKKKEDIFYLKVRIMTFRFLLKVTFVDIIKLTLPKLAQIPKYKLHAF